MSEDEEEDEDDDYFQDEDLEEEKKKKEVLKMKERAIAEDKKRNESPAIKEEVAKQTEPIELETTAKNQPVIDQVVEEEKEKKPSGMSLILPALQNHGFSDEDSDDDNESLKDPNEKRREEEKEAADLVAEIEALEVASVPVEKVIEPVQQPVRQPEVAAPSTPTTEKPATYEPIPFERPLGVPSSKGETIAQEQPIVEKPREETPIVKATMEDIQKELALTAAAVGLAMPTENHTQMEHKVEPTPITTTEEKQINHLAAILPAVEESVRNVKPQPDFKKTEHHVLPEDRERANRSSEFEYSIEDPIDLDMFRDNVIAIQAIDPKDIPANNCKPREQELAGKNDFEICVAYSV